MAAELPGLDEQAASAFALVALAGRPRSELGHSEEVVSEALARARKALRRAALPLPGSGWCERAERLVSDRFDDALTERGARVLDAHLGNCARCVEHERRLVQAQDALVARFGHSAARAPEPVAPAPTLQIIDTPAALPAPPAPEELPTETESASSPPAAAEPEAAPPAPRASVALAGGVVWGTLTLIAALLAVAAIAVAIAGALGASL